MARIEHQILSSFIFVHSALDDAGLSANEFRVYAHLARRANAGAAFPAVASIAGICRIHKDTVWGVLRSLEGRGMVSRVQRVGLANVYRLTTPDAWTHPFISANGKEGAPETEGWGAPETEGWGAPETEGYEGNPPKVIHLRRSKGTASAKSVRPTESEWVEYCTQTWPDWQSERAAESWAYYEGKGWLIGKSPCKDWKAVARTAHGNARDWGKLGNPAKENEPDYSDKSVWPFGNPANWPKSWIRHPTENRPMRPGECK